MHYAVEVVEYTGLNYGRNNTFSHFQQIDTRISTCFCEMEMGEVARGSESTRVHPAALDTSLILWYTSDAAAIWVIVDVEVEM